MNNYISLFLSPLGRINRKEFWLVILISTSIWGVVVYAASKIEEIITFNQQVLFLLIPWLFIAISIINITIKRYRDLNKAWYLGLLILIVPIIGWIVWIIDCGFKKGIR